LLLIGSGLDLEWKPSPITELPYLEKFSADPCRYKVFLFGGIDKNGKVSNDFYRIDLGKFELD